jgi:hypothetical protein
MLFAAKGFSGARVPAADNERARSIARDAAGLDVRAFQRLGGQTFDRIPPNCAENAHLFHGAKLP